MVDGEVFFGFCPTTVSTLHDVLSYSRQYYPIQVNDLVLLEFVMQKNTIEGGRRPSVTESLDL